MISVPDLDPHVFGLPDPAPDPSIILSSSKNRKKNLESYFFVTLLLYFLSLENDVNAPLKSNKQKNFLN